MGLEQSRHFTTKIKNQRIKRVRTKNEYPFEQGEVWETKIGIRYLVISIEGSRATVEKQPHKGMPGVRASNVPVRKTMDLCDMDRAFVRNVTEEKLGRVA